MSVAISKSEIDRLQAYLRAKFAHPGLTVVARPRANDSAEVMLGDEFIGVVYKDDEDGDISYTWTMAILSEDLSA